MRNQCRQPILGRWAHCLQGLPHRRICKGIAAGNATFPNRRRALGLLRLGFHHRFSHRRVVCVDRTQTASALETAPFFHTISRFAIVGVDRWLNWDLFRNGLGALQRWWAQVFAVMTEFFHAGTPILHKSADAGTALPAEEEDEARTEQRTLRAARSGAEWSARVTYARKNRSSDSLTLAHLRRSIERYQCLHCEAILCGSTVDSVLHLGCRNDT